jgi:alkylhydroperoxidase/carboxymuconolactone decarboxylase family protein YurZ
MSQGTSETPVMDLLATMTAASIEASNLDPRSLMLVRIAALVAVDAPPASYLLNLGAAAEADVEVEQVRDVFLAIAPIVGTARVASAAGKIVRALGLADLAIELEVAEEDDPPGEGYSSRAQARTGSRSRGDRPRLLAGHVCAARPPDPGSGRRRHPPSRRRVPVK